MIREKRIKNKKRKRGWENMREKEGEWEEIN